ncbi:L,D-transpeptidase family protein [Lactobacillus delbrueckii subsp. bulgaricus]|uniref:Rib/alpha-like domain-containing protein n=1 Tax=Lactobacillus delbrueckii TaxID=1584 RepID=UPI001E59AB4E|nr:Rib/alpha-like domain-containing protein [Lactobacillus delbrueckii]MCD5481472.1 L,D-transpeptidase family protein [Lactobacillus delbrueckii subsp. bulgaricus]
MKKSKYLTLLSVAALTLLTSGLGSQAVLADTDTAQTTNTSTNTTTDTSKTSTALNHQEAKGQKLTTPVGTLPNAQDAISNKAVLIKRVHGYSWKTTPDVSAAGSQKATVVITYTDGTTSEVEVDLEVTGTGCASQNSPVAKTGLTVKVGKSLTARSAISNLSRLKNVDSVTWKQAPSTAKAGTVKGTVLVTYTDKSTDTVDVTVKVSSVVTTKKSVKKSKKKQYVTKTRKIILDRPGKNKTITQKVKLSRTVTTTTTTTKTYTDGKLTKTSKKAKKSYGKWSKGTWKSYKVPAISGYKRSTTKVKAKTVTSKTKNITVKVSYKRVLHKPANVPYYDPADMRAKTGAYYFQSSEKRAYPNLAKYKNVWIRVSILGNRVYVMSGKKVIYTMYSSAGRFEMTNGKYQSDTPRGTFYLKAAYGPSFMSSDGVGARYYMAYYGSDYLFHSVPINNYGSGVYYKGYHYGYGGVGSTAHLTVQGTKPDSLGCIRLTLSDARWLYGQRTSGKLKVGTKVVIKYK